jgi:HSP20 family protein
MAIRRYQPSTDLFRPFFDDFSPFVRMGSSMRVPDTDVVERENEIRVMCELPGLSPEDVDISLENNVLTITGEKREERQEADEEGTWHLSERRWGRFSRSFVLPREVEQDRIEAIYDNGVLTVTIPKSEKARPRRIEVRAESGGTRRVQAGTREPAVKGEGRKEMAGSRSS